MGGGLLLIGFLFVMCNFAPKKKVGEGGGVPPASDAYEVGGVHFQKTERTGE